MGKKYKKYAKIRKSIGLSLLKKIGSLDHFEVDLKLRVLAESLEKRETKS